MNFLGCIYRGSAFQGYFSGVFTFFSYYSALKIAQNNSNVWKYPKAHNCQRHLFPQLLKLVKYKVEINEKIYTAQYGDHVFSRPVYVRQIYMNNKFMYWLEASLQKLSFLCGRNINIKKQGAAHHILNTATLQCVAKVWDKFLKILWHLTRDSEG